MMKKSLIACFFVFGGLSLSAQVYVGVDVGLVASGWYDLRDKCYGISAETNFFKSLGVKIGYKRATATWRDIPYYIEFAPGQTLPGYLPDYSASVPILTVNRDRIANYNFLALAGYNKRTPPFLISDINVFSTYLSYDVISRKRFKFTLNGGARYLDNKISDLGTRVFLDVIHPITLKPVEMIATAYSYEQQREWGWSFGVEGMYNLNDKVSVGAQFFFGSFPYTSTFETISLAFKGKVFD